MAFYLWRMTFGGIRTSFGNFQTAFDCSRMTFDSSLTSIGSSRISFGNLRTAFGMSRMTFGSLENDLECPARDSLLIAPRFNVGKTPRKIESRDGRRINSHISVLHCRTFAFIERKPHDKSRGYWLSSASRILGASRFYYFASLKVFSGSVVSTRISFALKFE